MSDIKKGSILGIFLCCILKLCIGSGYYYSYNDYSQNLSPVVSTYSGAVRGVKTIANGIYVSAFLGIPYAEPPVGNNRFKRTVPKRSWLGLYEATKKPPPCMQYSTKDFQWISKATPSEDCLYLNVWVPGKMNFGELDSMGKPVLLWIHGGGYFSGGSDIDLYDGATLAAQGNVIVVSINYRLGAFGFLTTGTSEAPGNMGLHDQYLAMEWAKNNIGQFNGDPDRITLLGQSAGAVSAGLHLISPLSRDLFRRAIMHSGSPYHPFLATDASVMTFATNLFASAVGCTDISTIVFTDPKKVLDCLRKMDPVQLAIAESIMLEKIPFVFIPIYGDDFMPQDPISAMNKGDFKHTEVLIGTTLDEGSTFLHYIMPDVFGSQVAPDVSVEQAKMLISGFFQNSTNPPPQVVADFYLQDASDTKPGATRKSVYDSYGDFLFTCPSVYFAEKFAQWGEAFFYYFTHRSSNSPWGSWMGVTHFDDIPFVFGEPIRNATCYTAEETLFSRSIIRKWATFAKTGVPVVSQTQRWPLFTYENPSYLELTPRCMEIRKGLHRKVCNFWRKYFVSNS